MIDLPPLFQDWMQNLLGSEMPAFLACYDAPPHNGLRANPLKISPAEAQARLPFNLQPLPWTSYGFLLAPEHETEGGTAGKPAVKQPGKHPFHAAGLYYLQEPSAMSVVEALDPQPGEKILDLSAAPGGKATDIAGRLAGRGVLVANEPHRGRVWALAENLERFGARNAIILNDDVERLSDQVGPVFDRVLLDAPCSGEGMFRKSPAARRDWSPEFVAGCARRQLDILASAARLVRPGGWLVYATCTFNPLENETVLADFLDEFPDFIPDELPSWDGTVPGKPDWVVPDSGPPGLARARRLWPHRSPGEGHFLARLRRAPGPLPWAPTRPGAGWQPLPASARLHFDDFCTSTLAAGPLREGFAPGGEFDGRLALAGSYVYLLPEAAPDLGDLRTLHPGWWLGVLKKGRFEPAHALALGLSAQDVQRRVALDPDGPEVRAYLRGETLPSAGDEGWVLITVAEFPLGWGKRVSGQVKNAYPRGLRWP